MGLALLATVTSLPELASVISVVTWVEAPHLAVGNVLGACVFNPLFLAVVDRLRRHQPMYHQASTSHLPEMAVTVSALRLGALDMAIGDLLGSNSVNPAILAIDDLFYRSGPLLADAARVFLHGA